MNKEVETISLLVGFMNGTYQMIDAEMEKEVREVMTLLIDNQSVKALEKVKQLKLKYLLNCMSCEHACGNTSPAIIDTNEQLEKIQQLKLQYNKEMPILDLYRRIAEIGA